MTTEQRRAVLIGAGWTEAVAWSDEKVNRIGAGLSGDDNDPEYIEAMMEDEE
jgi:hypothetical protein